jgi:flotillin
MENLIGLICGAGAAAGVLGFVVLIVKQFLFICSPYEVLIFSGRKRQLQDGGTVGYRIILGGRAVRIPIIERVDRMDLRNIPIDIHVVNAYSKGGIPLRVHAVANVKISSNPRILGNAIERFLGQDPAEIKRVAKETMEGHLRGVLANMTPEEVNEDRLKFAHHLIEEAGEDFNKLGLQLDILKVQSVSDEVNYLNSIGRQAIASVIRDAEVAEAVAKSTAEQVEARSNRDGAVANQHAETAIVTARNELREITASLDATAQSEEETTEQAALQARAEAEQKLQFIRMELEQTRLKADVVLPAHAGQRAAEFQARGEAAAIHEQGKAMAHVLQLMTDAWVKAGDNAKDIFLIQNLETVLSTIVDRVNAIEVKEVTVLDGGDGTGLAKYVGSYPAMVNQILRELRETTGVDVLGILSDNQGSK